MHKNVRQTIETETNTYLEDYGDLIVQNVGVGLLIQGQDLGAGETLPFTEVVADYEVMGDIDRYGADEGVLLTQKLRGLQVKLAESGNDAENLEFRYTFGFDADPVDRDRQDRNKPSPNSEVLPANEVNNDVLYHLSGTVENTIDDSTGGSSGTPYQTRSETNYLNEVGVLPEVTARDNLFEVLSMSTTTGADAITRAIKFFTNWQLYWLETDEEVEGRRIDLLE